MKKRWLLRLGLFAGVAVLGFWFVLWLTAPDHRITRAAFEQVKVGMTKDEAVAIIGVPPGVDTPVKPGLWLANVPDFDYHFAPNAVTLGHGYESWICETGLIELFFDKNGKVAANGSDEIVYGRFVPLSESLLDKLRRWLCIR